MPVYYLTQALSESTMISMLTFFKYLVVMTQIFKNIILMTQILQIFKYWTHVIIVHIDNFILLKRMTLSYIKVALSWLVVVAQWYST